MKVSLIEGPMRSLDLAMGSARTCYSQELIHPKEISNNKVLRDSIATSTREAGHLTTRQHGTYTFGIEDASRGVVWSTLHAHPFYNTEQQSQRYVKFKNGVDDFVCYLPEGTAKEEYKAILSTSLDTYNVLCKSLFPSIKKKYYEQFPAREKHHDKYKVAIRKLCMEEARYVLPLAAPTNLYYTISSLTLMRLAQMAEYSDFPEESRHLVDQMIELVCLQDPEWVNKSGDIDSNIIKPLLPFSCDFYPSSFDAEIGNLNSKLIAVSNIDFTIPSTFVAGWSVMTNPRFNELISNPLNLYSSSREMDLLAMTSFSFAKKLSFTAHAQQQRHRSLRDYYPFIAQVGITSEWITPKGISECEASNEIYTAHMEEYMERIQDFGSGIYFSPTDDSRHQHISYLLPNSYPVRVIESGDFLSYFHLWKQRVCLLAQHEIWQCSMDEVEQVMELDKVSDSLKDMLGAPCHLRKRAGIKPICPEGSRFCGTPVWHEQVQSLERLF